MAAEVIIKGKNAENSADERRLYKLTNIENETNSKMSTNEEIFYFSFLDSFLYFLKFEL